MADENWKEIKQVLGEHSLTLGPYFANQALNTPRHLLFTYARYKFAARLLPQDRGADVLELGCGEGLGTMMFAEGGHRVKGVDFDSEAIDYARSAFCKTHPQVTFECRDILNNVFGEFDAVFSIDVIEHFEKAREEEFVRTVCLNLRDNGFCVIGTPNETASQYASKYSQIGHVNLFTGERLKQLMSEFFEHVFLFGMNDEVVHTGFYPMCHYLMALACGKR